MMKTISIATGVAVALAGIGASAHLSAQAQSAKAEAPQVTGTVQSHVAAAKAAAGTEWATQFTRICTQAEDMSKPPVPRTPGGGGGGRQAGPPPVASWHAEPAKVFDNFYFVGMTELLAGR